MWGKKKTKLTLLEQRENVRRHLAKAIATNNFPEMERLEGNLYWLDNKIKKKKT